ncbi:MAG: zinc ABC transporter substrate-binding protein [Cyclobacteriaceae bacterium]|nr:zinc ABC transporter substrate-binding protein [Cyclobacteriaceae bacterium]UYN88565.1 MAG: zinc ABC transporter substrate-binding protein [Cyclobacteriaceae bacterium]
MRPIFTVIVSGLIVFACSRKTETIENRALKIVTTTGMIQDAVKNIAGKHARVEALMGPGVDPHLYKATQGDLKKLTEADIVFYNGLHLEGKMGEVLEKLSRSKPVLAVAASLPDSALLHVEGFNGIIDPHVWFDVKLWMQVVSTIHNFLVEIDPVQKSYYDSAAQAYTAQLDSLHRAIGAQLLTIPEEQRVLITAHDAFGYFGRAYNIQVRGLQGISTMAEFGLRDVTELVDFIIERKIKAIFVESSISPKSIQAVEEGCKKKNWQVKIGGNLYSDAMGNPGTPEGTYIGMVHANVKTIVDALK